MPNQYLQAWLESCGYPQESIEDAQAKLREFELDLETKGFYLDDEDVFECFLAQ